MSSQDWSTVTIHNPDKQKTVKKILPRIGCTSQKHELHKMEEADDTYKHTYIPKELSKELVQLRLTQKSTQKEMAHKLNIPLATYCEMENGKSIYNTDIKKKIQKIEQTYKIQFQHKKWKRIDDQNETFM